MILYVDHSEVTDDVHWWCSVPSAFWWSGLLHSDAVIDDSVGRAWWCLTILRSLFCTDLYIWPLLLIHVIPDTWYHYWWYGKYLLQCITGIVIRIFSVLKYTLFIDDTLYYWWWWWYWYLISDDDILHYDGDSFCCAVLLICVEDV